MPRRADMNAMITEDRKMLDLIQLARTVAGSKATVLIQGEAGAGKTLLADFIQKQSSRAQKNCLVVSCEELSPQEQETALFGDAGLATVSGGTVILEEISEMEMKLQGRLLHFLQSNEVELQNGSKQLVDVRVIVTSRKNLAEVVRQGSFREDLFYRLNVVNLVVPALRDRMGDIRILANQHLHEMGSSLGKPNLAFDSDAWKLLESHSWPGNLSELKAVVEKAANQAVQSVIAAREITLSRPIPSMAPGAELSGWIPGTTLDDIEREVILSALKYHQGNRTHTAKALGISIRTLRNKLADYRKIGIFA